MTDEGDVIAGRYRLLSRIGTGGMGVVWTARDERLDRVVAVKQLHLDPSVGEEAADEAMRRAMREGRVAARLRHPHAITVHDVVEHAGSPCLIMEFLPARSLATVLVEQGALPVEEVAKLGSQVAAALAAAHAEGIVHRDLKPGNVLLTDDGVAKIADFGISRAAGEATLTGENIIAGTPAYLSPEVAEAGAANFASDVYSLGATLYTAVEGHPPCGEAEHPVALLRRIAAGELLPPQRSGALTEVLGRMLHRDPAARPTMADVRDALTAVAEGRRSELPPPPDPTLVMQEAGARRFSRRVVAVAAAAAALVAAGVVIGVVVTPGETTGATASPPGSRTPEAPTTTPASTPPSTTTSQPDQGCVADYAVTNAWPGGYQVEVTVRNDTADTLTGWTVSWELPDGESIDGLWNGDLSQDGSRVTVTNANWNVNVAAGASTGFGFNASLAGDEPVEPEVSCEPA